MRRFTRLTPPGNRREAELFFADLAGEPARSARPHYPRAGQLPRTPMATPAPDDEDFSEAVPLGGRGRFRHEPLGGIPGDNVEARWNADAATASGTPIDVVVHLHGYSDRDDDAAFLPRKAAAAGVDLLDDAGAVRVRALHPTLALVPRGRHTRGPVWLFDQLRDRAAFDRLVEAGLSWLCATVFRLPAGSTLPRGRITLTAHSGGGAGLSALLAGGLDPDEVICFDSTYGGEDAIRRWAEARIKSPDAPRCGLRVFYRACGAPSREYPAGRWVPARAGKHRYESPDSWSYREGAWHYVSTEVWARRLHQAIERALAGATGGAALVNRFRVQRTSVAHNDIPAQYSPLLLETIAADVPRTWAPPPATTRPVCVENDDWLTRPPRKPGGDEPPPPEPTTPATVTTGSPPP